MFETRDNRAWTIIIVFGIVIGYFSLAWAGVVPDNYNIVKHYFGEIGGDDNTTSTQSIEYSQVVVSGIPTSVDLTAKYVNEYDIIFTASRGICEGMSIRINNDMPTTNATIEFSVIPGQGQWTISPDKQTAMYIGSGLIPYESVKIRLTISGDEFTRQGTVMVICGSNGYVNANTGLIMITN